MYSRKSLIGVLILLIAILTSGGVLAQSQTGVGAVTEIVVTTVEGADFPVVTLFVRSLNAEGLPVSGLSGADLQVTEDDKTVELIRGPVANEGGLWGYFVVDGGVRLGQANRWQKVQDIIKAFTEPGGRMQANDHIAVTVIEGADSILLTDYTTNGSDVVTALDSYRPRGCTDCFSDVVDPLEDILDDLDNAENSQNQPKFILFLTGELERYQPGAIDSLADRANSLEVPIYTVAVDGRGAVELVRKLGEDSGGASLEFDDPERAAADLDTLYRDMLGALRPQYEMAYRSPSGVASTRIVRVATADGRIVGENNYNIENIALPRVTIDLPVEASIVTPDNTDSVVAKVVFTDDHKRELETAVLKLNGQPVQTISNPPDPSQIEFDFPWDQIDESGSVKLEVEVKDEFNLSSRPGTVEVTADLPVVVIPTDTPTLSDEGNDAGIESTPSTGEDSAETVTPPTSGISNTVILISIALLAVVMVVLVLTRDKGPVKAARETIMRQVDRMTKRVSPSEVRAYLIVLEGDVNIGKHLELYGTTTIGRSKQDSDLLFQQYDDTSPISRRHCTIIDEEDHFKLRDEDSANGTFLNGVRLESMVPRDLQDGDEIEIARVERGGVKLQFQSVQPVSDSYDDYDDYGDDDDFRGTRVVKRDQPGDRF
ncbi:MAG: FHA domain-containing protein [Chloroflexi bacterium]|nr:FHA domain-containing protein [Chloroflexota bacterium]